MTTLTELLQDQNDRVTALEGVGFDDNAVIPKVEKIYDGISISSKIKVTRAKYFLCGQITVGINQKNTEEYEETYY